MPIRSYTTQPWRFYELFSDDTKITVGSTAVGSGELRGELERVHFDDIGETSE